MMLDSVKFTVCCEIVLCLTAVNYNYFCLKCVHKRRNVSTQTLTHRQRLCQMLHFYSCDDIASKSLLAIFTNYRCRGFLIVAVASIFSPLFMYKLYFLVTTFLPLRNRQLAILCSECVTQEWKFWGICRRPTIFLCSKKLSRNSRLVNKTFCFSTYITTQYDLYNNTIRNTSADSLYHRMLFFQTV